jgi:3-hydroxyisobutyrate dehydrogenase-like beta-hydroxyacid dehydrogenase
MFIPKIKLMIQPSPPEILVAAAGAAGILELGLAPVDEDEDEDAREVGLAVDVCMEGSVAVSAAMEDCDEASLDDVRTVTGMVATIEPNDSVRVTATPAAVECNVVDAAVSSGVVVSVADTIVVVVWGAGSTVVVVIGTRPPVRGETAYGGSNSPKF